VSRSSRVQQPGANVRFRRDPTIRRRGQGWLIRVDTRAQPISIGFDVMSPASDDRARATLAATERCRFARAAV